MKLTETSILRHLHMAAVAAVLIMVSAGIGAEPAWHEQHRGQDVAVHYVRLTGHLFDSKEQRRILEEEYAACAEHHQQTGKPVKPLPPEGMPEIPSPREDEIYYGDKLSVVISRAKTHSIDSDDCSLKVTPHLHMYMPVGSGQCKINLLEKTAAGFCKARGHGLDQIASADRSTTRFMDNIDAVPPARRAEVLALAGKMASRPQAALPLKPTGEQRHIAGYRCDINGTGSLVERCIARPKSDFAFPVASVNGFIPGLLLQVRSQMSTLDAQQVIMNMRVSRSLFEVPEGLTKASSLSKGKR